MKTDAAMAQAMNDALPDATLHGIIGPYAAPIVAVPPSVADGSEQVAASKVMTATSGSGYESESEPAPTDMLDVDVTWPSVWSRDVFRGWWEILRLAIPGSISLFIESGSYEISASMAAQLGATKLAVHRSDNDDQQGIRAGERGKEREVFAS